MPTYAAASSTVVQTPAVLATLNDYANQTLIPQGYVRTAFFGSMWGGEAMNLGLAQRPKVKLPDFRRATRKMGEGTQAEMILNFETSGNMAAFYGLQTLATGIYLGGTKVFSPWGHYSTYTALPRTTAKENTGAGKQYDLAKSQLEQSTRQAFTKLETDALSTNTDINHNTSQNELAGLQHWNASSPSTGTQHGLDRSVYTPFRNQVVTTTSFAATGVDDMDAMYYATAGTNGNEPCDVIWTDDTQHGRYAKQAQAIHRITGSLNGADLAAGGTLTFRGIPLIWHPSWPASRMDWLNNEYIHPYVLTGCDWEEETPGKANDVAIAYELRKYFTPAILVSRPETNGVHVINGA